ncbi:MAG: AAA family ATPase [Candidatus Micrarchaeaceae archaeon]
MILCITGKSGSGKTETSKILSKFGFEIIEMGSIIREEMKRQNIPPTPKQTKDFMLKLRELYGNDIVAKKIIEKIQNIKNQNIAIIGIRSIAEQKYFESNLKSIYTIAIIAPLEERFRRLTFRGRSDDPKNIEEFLKYREENQIKVGIEDAINNSEYKVENTGSIEELEKNIFLLFKELNSIDKNLIK